MAAPTVIEIDADRCDECGHHAYVYADHEDWAIPLAWCGSHGGRHIRRLTEIGATIVDRRHMIH